MQVTCPICGQPTQIRSENKNKTLRCPYRECGKSFRVMPDGETLAVAESDDVPMTATVTESEEGSIVIEYQEPEPETPSPRVADWQSGPPPVREEVFVETAPPPVRGEPPPRAEPGWEPPPVPISTGESYHGDEYSYYPTSHGRRFRLIAVGLIVLLIAASGVAGWYLLQTAQKTETDAFEKASKEFTDGNYSKAQRAFLDLAEKYPDSERAGRYRFMAALAEIRNLTQGAAPDVEKTHDRAQAFLKEHGQKPLFKEYRKELASALAQLADAAGAEAERKAEQAALDRARQVVELVQEHGTVLDDHAPRLAQLAAKLKKGEAAVAALAARKAILERIALVAQQQKPGGIEEVQQAFEAQVQAHPRLAEDAELKAQLDALRANEHAWVRYTPLNQELERPGAAAADYPYVLVAPLTQGKLATSGKEDGVVLGLARGVLYALSAGTGEPRWAVRVGLDSQLLPLRLPANPPQPEIALVLSAETNTLTAMDVQTGRPLWTYPLGAPCPAGPVLVGRRAFVPTIDGVIHELEVVDGRLLGRYEVGQPLTVPGAFDAVTRRLYIPADHKRIYVIDIEASQCAGVLYTEHSRGGLRGPPLAADATLVLAEAASLEGMKVRFITVAANIADTKFDPKANSYDVPGWSWFPPYFDGDTVGYVTDRGYLALFGVRRKTRDRPLFPLAPPLPLADPQDPQAAIDAPAGRAQVAQMDLDQWWVLVGGRLSRHRFDLYRQELTRVGSAPGPLGMPQHASQMPTRNRPLVLVTQAAERPHVLATAFDAREQIRWQRQLGMIVNQDPVNLGGAILALDQSGGLFQLDAAKAPLTGDHPWRTAGQWLASSVAPSQPPRLILAADGKAAFALVYDQATDQLLVRRYEPGKEVLDRTFRLESPPVGTPAALGDAIVVPCRDGNLREFSLERGGDAPLPLTWRDRNAGGQAAGHALFLSAEQLLVSDGLRRVQQWERKPGDKNWRKVAERTLELPARLATPVQRHAAKGGEPLLCVGDEQGTVLAISAGRLATVQTWRLGGRITAGPFPLGERLGVVLDQKRLVCLDLASGKPAWEYATQAAGIQGSPQTVGGSVLVSEIGVGFTWLDSAQGMVRGRQKLEFQVIPAAAAAALDPRTAFAPLSDGTALLLAEPRGAQAQAAGASSP